MNDDTAHREVLRAALEVIRRERSKGRFSDSFQRVDDVIQTFGETDLAARLDNAIDDSWPWEVVADLFGILVWSTSDNGEALIRTTEHWLHECADLRRVRIALHLDVFPCPDPAQMRTLLSKVASAFPQVEPQCSKLIAERGRFEE